MLKKLLLSLLVFSTTNVFAEHIDFYTAKYDVSWDSSKIGTMVRTYSEKKLSSISDLRGVYVIPLSDKRKEVSNFNIKNGLIYPYSYRMDRTGSFRDFVMTSNFNYSNNTVFMEYKDKSVKKSFNGIHLLDMASMYLQMQMDAANLKDKSYTIAYKTGFKHFNFKYNETIYMDTIFNNKTKVIVYNDKKTSLYFAPDYNNALVMLCYLDDSGKEDFVMKLSKYNKN